MGWDIVEKNGYEWFKQNIDINSQYLGRANSTVADIYSPKLNGYIEIKDLTHGARCGQFVLSTANDFPEAQEVLQGKATTENAKKFVKHWYMKKDVVAFVIYKNNEYNIYDINSFLQKYSFKWQSPYNKRSGSRALPKKDFSYICEIIPTAYWDDDAKKAFVKDENLIKHYFYHTNGLDSYYISTNKEIKKRARLNNHLTYHVMVE